MKFYSDFNSMFNAQSGLKKDMSVFNKVVENPDENGWRRFKVTKSGVDNNDPSSKDQYLVFVLFDSRVSDQFVFPFARDGGNWPAVWVTISDDVCRSSVLDAMCRQLDVWDIPYTIDGSDIEIPYIKGYSYGLSKNQARILADIADRIIEGD